MIKKRKFFAGFMGSQAKWLNSMSAKGYRMVKTGKLEYEFEECEPGQYIYAVEYVGDMSFEEEEKYKAFLEEMGYKVFYKNINLDYSAYKVTFRPMANKGGRVSSTAANSTYNKELLIVEKVNDGKPFELHTEKEDLTEYYKRLSYPWYFMVFVMLAAAVFVWPAIPGVAILGALAVLFSLPIIHMAVKIRKIKKDGKLEE